MQTNEILTNEAQLGTKLADSVSQSRRHDFAMLLAMLSQEPEDFSAFHYFKSDNTIKNHDLENLKNQVRAQKPCSPEYFDMTIGQHNAKRIAQNGLSDVRLIECLNPEPLHIRNSKKHINFEIIANCNHVTQQKYQRGLEVAAKTIDAGAIYDALASGEAQKKLINRYG